MIFVDYHKPSYLFSLAFWLKLIEIYYRYVLYWVSLFVKMSSSDKPSGNWYISISRFLNRDNQIYLIFGVFMLYGFIILMQQTRSQVIWYSSMKCCLCKSETSVRSYSSFKLSLWILVCDSQDSFHFIATLMQLILNTLKCEEWAQT